MDLADPRAQHYMIWCNNFAEVPTWLAMWWSRSSWLSPRTGSTSSFCFHPLHSSQSAQGEFTAFTSHHFITGSTEVKKPAWLQFFKRSLEGVLRKNQIVFRSPPLWGKEQRSGEERLELGRMLQLFHCHLVIAEFCSVNNRLQVLVCNNPTGKLQSVWYL